MLRHLTPHLFFSSKRERADSIHVSPTLIGCNYSEVGVFGFLITQTEGSAPRLSALSLSPKKTEVESNLFSAFHPSPGSGGQPLYKALDWSKALTGGLTKDKCFDGEGSQSTLRKATRAWGEQTAPVGNRTHVLLAVRLSLRYCSFYMARKPENSQSLLFISPCLLLHFSQLCISRLNLDANSLLACICSLNYPI